MSTLQNRAIKNSTDRNATVKSGRAHEAAQASCFDYRFWRNGNCRLCFGSCGLGSRSCTWLRLSQAAADDSPHRCARTEDPAFGGMAHDLRATGVCFTLHSESNEACRARNFQLGLPHF